MAMRIAPVPYFWALVTFSMLTDSDSAEEKFVDVSFRVKYKRLDQDEHETLMRRVQVARLAALTQIHGVVGEAAQMLTDEPAIAGDAPNITDREIIDQVMLDWDDMLGEDQQKLPFNKDNLERALKALGCRAAIVKRFFDMHGKAQEKNFARPPSTSSAG